jgi:hypothetical protein
LAGNNVYYLTVTAPSLQDESKVMEVFEYFTYPVLENRWALVEDRFPSVV